MQKFIRTATDTSKKKIGLKTNNGRSTKEKCYQARSTGGKRKTKAGRFVPVDPEPEL
jgi:hypothetical protein